MDVPLAVSAFEETHFTSSHHVYEGSWRLARYDGKGWNGSRVYMYCHLPQVITDDPPFFSALPFKALALKSVLLSFADTTLPGPPIHCDLDELVFLAEFSHTCWCAHFVCCTAFLTEECLGLATWQKKEWLIPGQLVVSEYLNYHLSFRTSCQLEWLFQWFVPWFVSSCTYFM